MGYVPFSLLRLTPHSLSRRARDMMAGDLGTHRTLSIDPVDNPEPATTPAPIARPVYSLADSQRAWAQRRADLDNLAGIDDLLDEIDARGKELQRRTAAILLGQADHDGPNLEE